MARLKPCPCYKPAPNRVFRSLLGPQGGNRIGAGAPKTGMMMPCDVDLRKPLGAWKRSSSTAKKQYGVERWIHDLRHHFISALAQTQTTGATIQTSSGHLSRKVLEHYSDVRLKATRRAVDALDAMAAQPVQ